ncbi:MAG: hypothetical protein KGK34_09990 [Chloroflexota bacterium]|nr:hypothetical protein [Chloroflexota bacterium]
MTTTDGPRGQTERQHLEKIDMPFFYRLGGAIHPLTENGYQASTLLVAYFAAVNARSQLDALWPMVEALTVCRRAGAELRDALNMTDQWIKPNDKGEQPDFNAPLPPFFGWQASQITTKATAFETVLTAELQGLPTYHATRKGIYSMPELIDNAAAIFPEAMRRKLTPAVIEEWDHCGRCLAFDNATASGFHSMRAVELVLHDYYVTICGPGNTEKLANWGAYIAALYKVGEGPPPNPDVKRVTALLQQIKDHDRNMISHPEITLEPDDALVLFEIAQGAIMAMAEGLPTR